MDYIGYQAIDTFRSRETCPDEKYSINLKFALEVTYIFTIQMALLTHHIVNSVQHGTEG